MRWLVALLVMTALIGIASAQPMHMPTRPAMHWNVTAIKNKSIEKRKEIREIRREMWRIRRAEKIERRIGRRMERRIKRRMMGFRRMFRHRIRPVRIERMRYLEAKRRYQELRRLGLRNPMAFMWAKRYICSGINYAESWMIRLRGRIMRMNIGEEFKTMAAEKIQNCLNELNKSWVEINSSKSPEELRKAVEDLKKVWFRVGVEIRSLVGQIIATRLMNITERAENVVMKIKAMAPNSSAVQTLTNDSLSKLEEAKVKLREAMEKFKEMENSSDPMVVYVQARSLLMEARDLIRVAFMEMKHAFIRAKWIVVHERGAGEMLAMGNGTVKAEFTGFATIKVNGTVTVTPAGSVVNVVGLNGTNGSYSGTGRIVVRGKDVKVSVRGSFKAFIRGYGTVWMSGSGRYVYKRWIRYRAVRGSFGNVTLELGVRR